MRLASLSSRAIIGYFYQKLEQLIGTWADKVSLKVESNQMSEEYKWLGMAPQLRKWIGGRIAKGLRENGIVIKNELYEATLEVGTDEIRRDKTGQIQARIDDLVTNTNAHKERLLSTLILNGASSICYDGQYFYDTDHSEGDSGTQSNKITFDLSDAAVGSHGTTTAPSVGEMALAILASISAMYGFKDDQGEPVNATAKEFLVVVPANLWSVAVAAVSNVNIDQGDTNTLATTLKSKGLKIDVEMNPRLTWTDKFTTFRTDGSVKPFIYQEELPVTVSAVAEGSELEFNERKHHYGVETSGGVGYGMWQQAVLVTLQA